MEDIQKLMKNPFCKGDFDPWQYWERNKIIGQYGILYLDRELGGISKSDLVIIGARSGAGKSSLAKIIYSANDKTKTALFSLENYEGDAEMSLLRKTYNELAGTKYLPRQWLTFNNLKINKNILSQALKIVNEKFGDAVEFGRTPPDKENEEGWKIESLTNKITWCATHGYNLIIIDHLDYLDKDNPNESDNSHVTQLMSAIRKAQEAGSAVIAFSHLRKPIGKVDDLIVPNENEFIGSSNKVKQATQVIMFAPANEGDADYGYATWCCIRKNRSGGIKNEAAKMYFLPMEETYKPEYETYSINYAGTKVSASPLAYWDEHGLFSKVPQPSDTNPFNNKKQIS